MSEEELKLDELSERTGVEPRTLRSWVSEGLLAPPFRPGRGARYPAGNADRALAVRALKELHGLSLSEIGHRFLLATDDQIREWALEAGPTSVPRGSAREYLSRVRARNASREPAQRSEVVPWGKMSAPSLVGSSSEPRSGRMPSRSRRASRTEARQEELASIERLILQLEGVLDAPAPRRSRGTIWTRISITPDVEISVRGDLDPRERVLFEQLADQFRAIITGRTK